MRTILIIFLAIAVSARAQDPKEIIKKYISTVSNGDIKNWKKISSVYSESIGGYSQDNFENKPDFDVMAPNFSKTYVISGKQKTEMYEDSTCSKMTSKFYFLKDKTVIFVGNMPPIEKPSKAPFRYLALPVMIKEWVDKASSIELLGIGEFAKDSVSCYEIEIKSKDGSERIYINSKTFLLEFTSLLQDGEYVSMTRYSRYKKFDDLLFPTKEVSTRNDVPFYWSQILKLELNVPFDPKEFTFKLEPLN